MKIISLKAENVKRLKAVDITPSGAIVEIAGKNAQGKTSILDCITMAFLGKKYFPDNPIRSGQKKGSIDIDLGEFKIKVSLTQKGQALKITTKDNLQVQSPQAFLDKLVGKISFDPMAFIRLPDKEQVRTLMQMMGVDPFKFDGEIKAIYDARTDIGRDEKRIKGHFETLTLTPGLPVEEQKTADLVAEVDEIRKYNDSIDDRADAIEESKVDCDKWLKQIAQAKENVEKGKQYLADAEVYLKRSTGGLADERSDLDSREKTFAELKKKSTDEIQARINSVDDTNAKIRVNAQYHKAKH